MLVSSSQLRAIKLFVGAIVNIHDRFGTPGWGGGGGAPGFAVPSLKVTNSDEISLPRVNHSEQT
jgi:hypothetical protein